MKESINDMINETLRISKENSKIANECREMLIEHKKNLAELSARIWKCEKALGVGT